MSGYLENPIWIKFLGRRIIVLSLSGPELGQRDARALLRLQRFLPHSCEYVSVTLDNNRPLYVPVIPPDAGIVILGRPAFYGGVANLLEHCLPSLFYEFASDDPSDTRYRNTLLPDRECS